MNKSQKETKDTILAKPLEITPAMFDGKGVIDIVDNLDKELRSIALDATTKTGRDECISLSARVRSSKAHIDEVGAKLVKPIKDRAKIIDTQRKYCRDKLDELALYLRKPATDWENAESERQTRHRNRIQRMISMRENAGFKMEPVLRQDLEELDNLYAHDYQEYQQDAQTHYLATKKVIEDAIVEAQKRMAEKAELEKLRREKDERERQEREQERACMWEPRNASVVSQVEVIRSEPLPPAPVQKPVDNSRERMRIVHNEIVDAIMRCSPMDQATAQAIVIAVVMKKIPHLSISYNE